MSDQKLPGPWRIVPTLNSLGLERFVVVRVGVNREFEFLTINQLREFRSRYQAETHISRIAAKEAS